jgi:hypothetical protein
MASMSAFDDAAAFIAGHARRLEQLRFAWLFRAEAATTNNVTSDDITAEVATYRNPDGGFGHAMEPDLRCAASQPAAVEMALRVMDECDAWDETLVGGACDWLASVAPAAGGAAALEDGADQGPHAPWWVPEEGHPPSLVLTGMIAGTLYARGHRHQWLEGATHVMWDGIEAMTEASPYPLYGVLRFLQHVPDRDRAHKALAHVGPLVLASAEMDPEAPGETHSPLEFAPTPSSMARELFDDAIIDAHLDHLAAAQLADGGWTFNWLAWSGDAERDWRGIRTLEALLVLRAYGRQVTR